LTGGNRTHVRLGKWRQIKLSQIIIPQTIFCDMMCEQDKSITIKEAVEMAGEGFEEIRSEVIDAGGIKCFKMQQLREASPYKKLGPGVNLEISQALAQKGLGHTELGMYQEESAYVFEQGSHAARLINSIIGGASDDGAKAILDAVAPDSKTGAAEAKLAEVKALLVQLDDVFQEPEAA
jgi:hypothetical protein